MALSTHLSLRSLCISIRLSRVYSWHLFFRRVRCGSGCIRRRRVPRVLRGELGFAFEDFSVLGLRSCVPAAQRDQQGRGILPSDPLISQESRLWPSCVRVEVSLKQIWLGGKMETEHCFHCTVMDRLRRHFLIQATYLKAYLSWYSHRNGFHFPFMQFVEPKEDQEICQGKAGVYNIFFLYKQTPWEDPTSETCHWML